MIPRRAPARPVLLCTVALAVAGVLLPLSATDALAASRHKANPASPIVEPPPEQAEAPPMPALTPAIPYRPLNWYTRSDLALFPPGSAPDYIAPWCGGAYVAPPLPKLEGDDLALQSPVYVAADQMQLDENGESQVAGMVEVRQGQNLMRADSAVITNNRDKVTLTGHVYLQDPAMTLEADSAELTLDGSGSHIVNARYALHGAHMRGSARTIHRASAWQVAIDGGMYTTCEPGHDTWAVGAEQIRMDQEAGWGSARHMWLKVQSVPVLYVPYVSFPLDKRRRTGVLYPTITVSGDSGLDVAVPYYFNLDPQADLLLRPRLIEERGALLEGEFRYLHGSPSYSVGEGSLAAGWMAADRAYNDEARHVVRFRHVGNPRPEWQVLADATDVSDVDYLDDLDTQLSVNRESHLDRVLQTSWTTDSWTALGRVQAYQTINPLIAPLDLPYRRLPQLLATVALPPVAPGVAGALLAEYTYFERDTAALPNPVGSRLRLEPGLAWDLGGETYRLQPAVRLRHASYVLSGNAIDRPQRSVATLSLDGALFFERDVPSFQGAHWTQTLEPRLFALWTPYEDQDDIPVFDSSLLTFGYDQLFRDNRFTGGDRVGDARQLSLAVETRLLADDGSEALRAGIGQAVHFADRRVQLSPLLPAETDELSPLVADATWRVNERLSTRADSQWAASDAEFVRGGVRVNWQDERFRTVNAGWRYDDPGIDQVELSGLLPVDDNWTLVGRWLYELDSDRSLEVLAGVEFESCCWRGRLFARRTLDIDATTGLLRPDQGVVFEIELKGLGSLGEKISTELANDIPGYERRLRAQH